MIEDQDILDVLDLLKRLIRDVIELVEDQRKLISERIISERRGRGR